MILVTGSVRVQPDRLDEAIALSLEHVRRSRLEPGCLLHSVHQDVEDRNRLMFLEHWADRDALTSHFHVPESNEFVKAVSALAVEPPEIKIYEVPSD
jgi:quinol monooxygenase YgiN